MNVFGGSIRLAVDIGGTFTDAVLKSALKGIRQNF